MSRDEYGRGPVMQAIDKTIAGASNKRIAEFMYSVIFFFAMFAIFRLDLELWAQALGIAVLLFLSGAAYVVGTCDANEKGVDQ